MSVPYLTSDVPVSDYFGMWEWQNRSVIFLHQVGSLTLIIGL